MLTSRRDKLFRGNSNGNWFPGQTVGWQSGPGNLLSPGFSLTRASTGIYFDSAGLLQTAAIDAARGTYRWNGSAWVFDGTIIESAATNLLSYTNNLSSWGIFGGTGAVTQNAIGLNGANSGWTTTDTSAAGTTIYFVQTASLAAGTRTLSFYVNKTVGAQSSYPVLILQQVLGSRLSAVTIDTSNGIATAWTAYTGFTINTTTTSITSFSADLWAVTLTMTSVGTTEHIVNWCPAGTTNATQSTGVTDPAAQGSAGVTSFQYEDGTAATSYIDNPSTGTVTRSADVLTASSSGLLVNAQGFAAISGRIIAQASVADRSYLSTFDGAAGGAAIYQDTIGMAVYDGTAVRYFNSTTIATAPLAGATFKIATTWAGSSCNGAYNGLIGTPTTFDGSMNFGATLQIGSNTAGAAGKVSIVLQSLRLGIREISSPQLAAFTG